MGIVWISIPAHEQANRFKAVASLGTVGTVFRACRRLPETTTFRFRRDDIEIGLAIEDLLVTNCDRFVVASCDVQWG